MTNSMGAAFFVAAWLSGAMPLPALASPSEFLVLDVEATAAGCAPIKQTVPMPLEGGSGRVRYDVVCEGGPRSFDWRPELRREGGGYRLVAPGGTSLLLSPGKTENASEGIWSLTVSIRIENE